MGKYATVALILLVVFCFFSSGVNGENNAKFYKNTYKQLDFIREQKKKQLADYLERINKLAKEVANDDLMRKYFVIKKKFYELQKKNPAPADSVKAIEDFKESIRQHYLRNYLSFYDIFFVGKDGFVFSTLRNQSDYHKNLFEDKSGTSTLGSKLQKGTKESFVDYEFDKVTDEPSAFFIEPMIVDGEHSGWFIMQCSINKINSIFSRSTELGQTGEVFLVNRKNQMLTESRLTPLPSILRQHLSPENIESKFKERKGHKIVIDYRDKSAVTSFEVCPVLSSEWLLIAKIDEDEVVTREFMENYQENIVLLEKKLSEQKGVYTNNPEIPTKLKVVDMDEFRKAQESQLITFGVSTCTAVVVSLPQRFSYMAHASVYDCIYKEGGLDLLGHMLGRVRKFEIRPYEINEMDIAIIAPHLNSLNLLLKKLVDSGFFLSQIEFMYNPKAASATVIHNRKKGTTAAEWRYYDSTPLWQRSEDTVSLGNLAKGIIRSSLH